MGSTEQPGRSTEQPVLVAATSGRSKCKACVYLGGDDPTIQMGSMRVGIPGHARGVTVFHYCHPACFAKYCLRVDTAPTGRARCKADGSEISKGATRLLIGYKKEASLFKVENAQRTNRPEAGGAGWRADRRHPRLGRPLSR